MTGASPHLAGGTWSRRRTVVVVAVSILAVVGALLAIALTRGHRGSAGPAGPVQVPGLSGSQALLSGRVEDAASKAPLSGVVIRVQGSDGAVTARTDQQGRYQVVLTASGPIAVTVDLPGYTGEAAFGSLCPGERVEFSLMLTVARSAGPPSAPLAIPSGGGCG